MNILLLLRRRLLIVLLVGVTFFAIVLHRSFSSMATVQQTGKPPALVTTEITTIATNQSITPIPERSNLELGKVNLGRRLFNDVQLSKNDRFSCASCHDLKLGGGDGRVKTVEQENQFGALNTPTILNASLNFKQFWDGRAANLEDQIDGPIHNPREMGTSWPEVVTKLQKDPQYVAAFRQLYGRDIQENVIKDAIATYEKSLTTPNSRFDRFLKGDSNAITPDEKAGHNKFKDYGCIACHQGANLGGNMYQSMGIMADYFQERGNITKADYGRFNQTGDYRDRYVFKVPSLRNIELTAPYLHDGNAATLPDAVKMMAKYQLGRPIPETDVNLIVKFLKTLTGDMPKEDA